MRLSTCARQARTALLKLGNQQQAELAGVNYASHFVTNQRWHSANIVIDNMAAIYSTKKIIASPKGVLPESCAHRARTVRPFAYSVSGRSTLPESELPWLVAGLPVYYHRSNGDRVSATVVDPSSRGGRRVDALLEPQLPEVEAEAPRIDDHEPECCGG